MSVGLAGPPGPASPKALLRVQDSAAAPRLGLAVLASLEAAVAVGRSGLGVDRQELEAAVVSQGLVWEDGLLDPEQGNLLDGLVLGSLDLEQALLVDALLGLGLRARLQALSTAERPAVLDGWLRLGDALLVSSPLNPYRYLPALLDEPLLQEVFVRFAEGIARDLSQDPVRPVERIRALLRLEVIVRLLPQQLGEPLLARIGGSCRSAAGRRVLGGYLAAVARLPPAGAPAARAEAATSSSLTVAGDVLRPARGALVTLLQALVGWSLLRGVVLFVGRLLLGARHQGQLSLEGETLHLQRRRRLLGRVVRERQDTVALTALQGWGGDHRRSTALLLLGVLAFCSGSIAGLFVMLDSLRAGFPLFALVGLLIVGIGVALDLATLALYDLGAGRSTLWLLLPGQEVVRLASVPAGPARQLIAAIQEDRHRGSPLQAASMAERAVARSG